MNRAIVVAAVLTFSAITAWAQDQACTEDYLNETYTKWYEPYSHRDDPKQKDAAYTIAKEYVSKCPNEFADNPYAKALKSYVKVYEQATATGKVGQDFTDAIKKLNYKDILRTGKAYLATDGENSTAYLWMGTAGLSDPSLVSEAAQYAPKAIQLVEAGKAFDPYKSKEEALAQMNYLIAKSKASATPADAIPYFVKALRYESDLKKNPAVYNELATAYGEGPVDKYAKDYKAAADAGKSVDSPEVKLIIANLNQAFDGQIDAFARAAAVSTNAADKQAIMKVLGEVYKDRFRTDATADQLNTMVAGAISKPIPDAPKQITELPAGSSTPGGTSATGTNGSSGNSSTTAGSSAPGSSKPVGSAPTSSTTTKPTTSGSTTPARPTATPRPRQPRNHRG